MRRALIPLPSRDLIAARMTYNKTTGQLRWRHNGKLAGYVRKDGYVHVGFGGELYLAHRLIFMLVTGLQVAELDHRNGDPSDNRWCNIRPARTGQNLANMRAHRDNKTGLKGVVATKGKYRAQICKDYKIRRIGTYDTPEQAKAAYDAASRKQNGEFHRS